MLIAMDDESAPPGDLGDRAAQRRRELAARVRAGGDAGWLTTGELADLLDTSLRNACYLVESGQIAYRQRGEHGWRYCDPADVVQILDAWQVPQRRPQRTRRRPDAG